MMSGMDFPSVIISQLEDNLFGCILASFHVYSFPGYYNPWIFLLGVGQFDGFLVYWTTLIFLWETLADS